MLRAIGRAFLGTGGLTGSQGAVLVVGASIAFSVTAIAYRAVESASDWQFLTYRGASTGGAMVLLIALRRMGRRPVAFTGTTWHVFAAAALLAGASAFYILALARTTAALTLFLLGAAPVFAAGFGWALLRERIDVSTLIAMGLTALGITVMVGSGLDAGASVGLLFAGCIPICVGLYSVLMRSRSSVDPVVPTLLGGAMLTAFAAVGVIAGSGLSGVVDIGWRDLSLAVVTGGVALGIGLPMFNLGHRALAPARVTLLMMTEVVLAPLWVWIWPGERPSAATLTGGAIVIAAVVFMVARSRAVEAAPAVVAPSH